MIGGLALGLLGRHVADRPENRAGRRPGAVLVGGHGEDRINAQLRETEVEHLGAAGIGHHQVVRLQIAMNDARGVGGGDRIGRVAQIVERPLEIQTPRIDERAQRWPSTSSMAMLHLATARPDRHRESERLGRSDR